MTEQRIKRESRDMDAGPRPIPAHIRKFLGPAWVIEGEDPGLYEELLAKVAAIAEPEDIIDWILISDVVAIIWEIQRTRRQRDILIRAARCDAMAQLLAPLMPGKEALNFRDPGIIERARELVAKFLQGEKEAAVRVPELLKIRGFTMTDVTVHSLNLKARELADIDRENQLREDRRDKLLREIERRQVGWSKQVRRATEDAVEAKCRETPPEEAIEQRH